MYTSKETETAARREERPRPPQAAPVPSVAALLALQRTAGNASVARWLLQRQAPEAATEAPHYSLSIHGVEHPDLSAEAAAGLLDSHAGHVAEQISAGADLHAELQRVREEHPIAGWIVDAITGAEIPAQDIWDVPRALLAGARGAIADGRIEDAGKALDRADLEAQRCEQLVADWRSGAISGAETGKNIALGTAVVCVVAMAAAGGAALGVGAAGAGAGGATTGAVTTGGGATTGVVAAEAAEVAIAAGGPTVTVAESVAGGAVRTGGVLFRILSGIEEGFAASRPAGLSPALGLINRAVQALGYEAGVIVGQSAEVVILENAGGVTTYVFATGQITVMSSTGAVILNLVP
ncbi:hypothetical protein OM076_03185 [Solirubrobacter ginsenosidimutans]|uniref:Uncharacterized protein n=1 Tax=Solirubrobacter ginsenosidimutans TaxID=490573 RepID=A0A9X3MQ86_9ACTN|nr:hypothetical protein [Solirubrobacter ginsenosidimutans]MDA0159258.1 hypothetical protein [Solirubrobacter ginsenosidimutans]